MRRRRRKNRHVQLRLNLEFGLLTEAVRREEEVDSCQVLSQALIFKHRTAEPDPFFRDLTGHPLL
ncbi:MAG TPA: hypothetical protein GXZ36_02485 [Firmicutes bacterium]|nr:hypothetical protein [Bacillota bacterium]